MSWGTPFTAASAPSEPPLERPLIGDGSLRDWTAVLSSAERACCCPARPVVTVLLPLTADRPDPIDLLLCGHHYRSSRKTLGEAGAIVFDATGEIVTTETWLVA